MRLRFKIKDENGFALIKCKAKNEVGLQQRACLFRVVQAQAPILRHNCKLASAVSRSLQLKCEPNEHLKTEEFEMVRALSSDNDNSNKNTNRASSSSSSSTISSSNSLSRWFDLETIRNQQQQEGLGGLSHISHLDRPRQRLAFPANWLLVELYKWRNNSTVGGEQTNSDSNTKSTDGLTSYVIVSLANHLAHIKSMIEENRLFSQMPRSIYYVAARPLPVPQQQQPLDGGNDTSGQLQQQQQQQHLSDSQHLVPKDTSQILEDATIQLASSFVFTMPNLEPATPYRLHIYGQNLANKTRDCLVIGGETLNEENFSKNSNQQQQPMATRELFGANLIDGYMNNNNNNNGGAKLASDQPPEGQSNRGGSADSTAISQKQQQQQQQQKSIVMRSDDEDQANQMNTSNGQLGDTGSSSNSLAEQSSSSSIVGRLTGGASLTLNERLHQLGLYRDYAISYAKQRPLLAASMAFTSLLLCLIFTIWVGNALVGLIRKETTSSTEEIDGTGGLHKVDTKKRRKFSSTSGECDLPQSKGGGSSSAGSSSSSSSFGADGAVNGSTNTRASSSHLFKSSLDGSNPYGSAAAAAAAAHMSPPIAKHNSIEPLIKGNLQMEQHHQYHIHHQQQQQQDKYPGAVYTIGHMEVLNGTNNNNNLSKIYGRQEQQQQSSCHFSANSLDRRQMLHSAEPIYLTESDRTGLLQLHNAHIGSIDRRLPTGGGGGFIGYATGGNKQQPPMLLTELGRLENGSIYLGSQDEEHHQHQQLTDDGDRTTMMMMMMQNNEHAASSCYEGSFSSSNECHSVEQNQIAGNVVSSRVRSQRVAFDLSHQQQQQLGQYLCPEELQIVEGGRRSKRDLVVVSPQQQQQQQQPHDHINSQPGRTTSGKGSDSSGGSNSGNTGDSGLESPATGETNSLSYNHAPNCPTAHLMMAQQQQQQRQHQLLPDAAATNNFTRTSGVVSPIAQVASSNHHHHHHLIECSLDSSSQDNQMINTGQPQQANLVMLMELSPGSQESSTLMHSVDSFGEIQQQQQQPQEQQQNGSNNIRFLRNNHQMATSFTTSPPNQQLQPIVGEKLAGLRKKVQLNTGDNDLAEIDDVVDDWH